MVYLRYNAQKEAWDPYSKPNNEFFWVTKKVDQEVFLVGAWQNSVWDLPLLVDEHVLLRVSESMHSKCDIDWFHDYYKNSKTLPTYTGCNCSKDRMQNLCRYNMVQGLEGGGLWNVMRLSEEALIYMPCILEFNLHRRFIKLLVD